MKRREALAFFGFRPCYSIQKDPGDLWLPGVGSKVKESPSVAINRIGICSPLQQVLEVSTLEEQEGKTIVVMEARTRQRHLDYAELKGRPRGIGVPFCEGLWPRAVKGCCRAIPRPGSMTEYIRQEVLLPPGEIDRLIAATPTEPLTQADFERLGFSNWQDRLDSIRNTIWQGCDGEQLLLQFA